MKTKNKEVTFIKLTEKERSKKVLIVSTLVSLVYWAIYGLFLFSDALKKVVSCNGFFSCSYVVLGRLVFFLIIIASVWIFSYLITNLLVSGYRKK